LIPNTCPPRRFSIGRSMGFYSKNGIEREVIRPRLAGHARQEHPTRIRRCAYAYRDAGSALTRVSAPTHSPTPCRRWRTQRPGIHACGQHKDKRDPTDWKGPLNIRAGPLPTIFDCTINLLRYYLARVRSSIPDVDVQFAAVPATGNGRQILPRRTISNGLPGARIR